MQKRLAGTAAEGEGLSAAASQAAPTAPVVGTGGASVDVGAAVTTPFGGK